MRYVAKSWITCYDFGYPLRLISSGSVFGSKCLSQEYPTEPLDKIPALQGRIALAGKLNIGHMHLLENIYKHYSGWEFMLQRWL